MFVKGGTAERASLCLFSCEWLGAHPPFVVSSPDFKEQLLLQNNCSLKLSTATQK